MKKMAIIVCLIGVVGVSGCAVAPRTTEGQNVLRSQVDEAVAVFRDTDPEIQHFFDTAYGYAIFPRVTKAAWVLGGSYGRGEVYEQGQLIGYNDLTGGTIGFSGGAQFFREIIFFENKFYFDRFIDRDFSFAAEASAIALTWGAAAKANYDKGMIVFVQPDTGVMVDASIGAQRFRFAPTELVRR